MCKIYYSRSIPSCILFSTEFKDEKFAFGMRMKRECNVEFIRCISLQIHFFTIAVAATAGVYFSVNICQLSRINMAD